MPDAKNPSKTDKSKETRHAAAEKGLPVRPPEKRTFEGGKTEKKG